MLRARKLPAALIVALGSIAVSVIVVLLAPLPVPQFHDEFSYLLAGETFARGRVTNPSHVKWEFFETFQVLSQPSYASKYPPAQGAILALGIVLSGEPLLGVWISTAIACSAITWMLGAVVSRRWAILCGLFVAIHPLVLDWNWSYWGGSIALGGGALVAGATLRLRRSARWIDGAIAAIGMSVLANSRPVEGAVLSVVCIGWLVIAARGRIPPRVFAAIAVVLAVNFAWMGYYNWRVTGSATTLPYWEYERQYAYTRPLAWMPLPATAPAYRHTPLREYYLDWEAPRYQRQRSIGGFIEAGGEKLWNLAKSYGRAPTLAIALLALPLARRRGRGLLFATPALAICLLNALPVLTLFPHYLAPAAPLLVLLIVVGCIVLRSRRGWKTIVPVMIVGQLVVATMWMWNKLRANPNQWNVVRRQMIDELSEGGRKALIFVRSDPGYYWHNEYVYNSPDIDSQPVVWARDIGETKNRELIEYYDRQGGRELLLLDNGRELRPYAR